MATSRQVDAFLQQANARAITDQLPDADVATLATLGLVQRFTPEELRQIQQEVDQLASQQAAMAAEYSDRSRAVDAVATDTRTTHSILFHLRGVDAQHATLERLQSEQAAVKNLDQDLAQRQQAWAQLLIRKSTLDMATPYNGGYLGITTAGRVALRDLDVRLYRVGDQEFQSYWADSKKTNDELAQIADGSAQVEAPLASNLRNVDPSYLWAVAIGMVKTARPPKDQLVAFLESFTGVSLLSPNVENQLLAAEVVSALPTSPAEGVALLRQLTPELLDMGVAEEVAVGAAAILLLGRRADGTFATEPLAAFLARTPSVESAALLAIVNRPIDELATKFLRLKELFASWGYSASEDTELSAAYLTVSDLPADSIGPKLAILARGIGGYLQYPLVAASILASIPVLEANETLNLLEKAYEILGQRTGPMVQAELVSLAVRMIHGIQVATVDEIDPTAKVAPAIPGFSYGTAPPIIWMPVFITHHVYFATFSGIGGPHPGHVHSWGGGGWGGGGFVG